VSELLNSTPKLLPLYVPVFTRTKPHLLERMAAQAPDYPLVIVAQTPEHAKHFANVYGSDKTVLLECDSLGEKRNLILTHAAENGHDAIIELDDDITRFAIMVEQNGAIVKRDLPLRGGDREINGEVWNLFRWFATLSKICLDVFAKFPSVVHGGVLSEIAATIGPDEKKYAVALNSKTPRRAAIWHTTRALNSGIFPIVTPAFHKHGDDICEAIRLFLNGDDQFSIGALRFGFDNDSPSTLRATDVEQNRAIHAKEYADLLELIGSSTCQRCGQRPCVSKLLRANKQYPDGAWMFGNLDFSRALKHHPAMLRHSLPMIGFDVAEPDLAALGA